MNNLSSLNSFSEHFSFTDILELNKNLCILILNKFCLVCMLCRAGRMPVCASNGKTYYNSCTFNYKKCKAGAAGASWKIVRRGPCKRGRYLMKRPSNCYHKLINFDYI